MKLKTFAIRDNALDSFGATFQHPTVEAGLRMFRDIILYSEGENRYRRSPEDYVLYMVGEYDDANAEQTNIDNVRLASANEIIMESQKETNHGA